MTISSLVYLGIALLSLVAAFVTIERLLFLGRRDHALADVSRLASAMRALPRRPSGSGLGWLGVLLLRSRSLPDLLRNSRALLDDVRRFDWPLAVELIELILAMGLLGTVLGLAAMKGDGDPQDAIALGIGTTAWAIGASLVLLRLPWLYLKPALARLDDQVGHVISALESRIDHEREQPSTPHPVFPDRAVHAEPPRAARTLEEPGCRGERADPSRPDAARAGGPSSRRDGLPVPPRADPAGRDADVERARTDGERDRSGPRRSGEPGGYRHAGGGSADAADRAAARPADGRGDEGARLAPDADLPPPRRDGGLNGLGGLPLLLLALGLVSCGAQPEPLPTEETPVGPVASRRPAPDPLSALWIDVETRRGWLLAQIVETEVRHRHVAALVRLFEDQRAFESLLRRGLLNELQALELELTQLRVRLTELEQEAGQ